MLLLHCGSLFCSLCLVAEVWLLCDVAGKYRLFFDSEHQNTVELSMCIPLVLLLFYCICTIFYTHGKNLQSLNSISSAVSERFLKSLRSCLPSFVTEEERNSSTQSAESYK